MIVHQFHKRVRYGETDQMGYLYYGQYAQYYEIGRVELMRSIGITYKNLEKDHQIMMPVVHLESRFIRPAFYDEMLTIQTTLNKIPSKFIHFSVEIFNEQNKLVNGGKVKLCFVDIPMGKSIQCPDFLLNIIQSKWDIQE
jgi:acyl-CoA thioester hydrolase